MRSIEPQLKTYSSFLEPPELAKMRELLQTGKFGAEHTNGLVTSNGRSAVFTGRAFVPGASNSPAILESRQNLLDFIQNNSATPKPGVPTVQGASRAMADNAPRMGISQADASILDDVASGRPSPTPPAARPSVPVSQVIPDRRPLMTATQPAPAAPRPTAPQTPTKVSATPTVRGTVQPAVRIPAPSTPMSALSQAPGARLAGQAVEANPGLFGGIFDDVWGKGSSQGKDALRGVTQGAGKAKGAVNGLIRGNAGRIIGGGGVLAALSAASEFADTEDPLMRNASQAVGNLGGGLAGAAAGAAIGSVVPVIGTGIGAVVGGIAGGMGGSSLGSNIGGGVYDMFNNTSPEQRARDAMVKNAAVQRNIAEDDLKSQMVIQEQAMAMRRNDDFERQARDLKVQNDYNYANAINQAMINSQQNASMQQIAIAQAMMG